LPVVFCATTFDDHYILGILMHMSQATPPIPRTTIASRITRQRQREEGLMTTTMVLSKEFLAQIDAWMEANNFRRGRGPAVERVFKQHPELLEIETTHNTDP
jgi:hypothetical protein